MIMNRTEIIDSINNWEAIKNDNQKLTNALDQGNSFTFKLPSYASQSQYIHAYPGIHNSDLVFLLIPSDYDNSSYNANFDNYTTVCQIKKSATAPTSTTVSTVTSARISATEAQNRIDDWDNNYRTWIPRQTATPDGIFQAFAIPITGFEVAESLVNLGLKNSSGGIEVADIVVTNKTSTTIYYDDFANPVPPFSPASPQSSFYLLQL